MTFVAGMAIFFFFFLIYPCLLLPPTIFDILLALFDHLSYLKYCVNIKNEKLCLNYFE